VAFGDRGDLRGKLHRQNNKRFVTVTAHDQQIRTVQPLVQLLKAVGPHLHFDAAIDAKHRHRKVAAETTTRGTAQRDAFGAESMVLQIANKGALRSVALLP
jgi:hypothetical protein